MATSEPVVLHHGREEGRWRSRRGAAVCFNGLLGGAVSRPPGFHLMPSFRRVRSGSRTWKFFRGTLMSRARNHARIMAPHHAYQTGVAKAGTQRLRVTKTGK
jgi:hypothetical protein